MTDEVPLTKLRRGDKATVVGLPADDRHLRKLVAFGVLPGTDILLLQTFPGYVLSVGNTVLAVDKEIAGSILVRK
jgi:Fe2+ transport system protein FeoA